MPIGFPSPGSQQMCSLLPELQLLRKTICKLWLGFESGTMVQETYWSSDSFEWSKQKILSWFQLNPTSYGLDVKDSVHISMTSRVQGAWSQPVLRVPFRGPMPLIQHVEVCDDSWKMKCSTIPEKAEQTRNYDIQEIPHSGIEQQIELQTVLGLQAA